MITFVQEWESTWSPCTAHLLGGIHWEKLSQSVRFWKETDGSWCVLFLFLLRGKDGFKGLFSQGNCSWTLPWLPWWQETDGENLPWCWENIGFGHNGATLSFMASYKIQIQRLDGKNIHWPAMLAYFQFWNESDWLNLTCAIWKCKSRQWQVPKDKDSLSIEASFPFCSSPCASCDIHGL